MRKRTPKVSVVMSVRDGEKFLSSAVESILNQTFEDYEFIIMNDGSTDGTRKLLESFTDPRIVLINQDKNGLTKSLNKGLARAQGEYIARMDADDVSLPERFERQVSYLDENRDVALVGCIFKEIDEEGNVTALIEVPLDNEEIQWRLLFHNCFAHSATVFRKRCLSYVGAYDERILYAQDYDLWLRIAKRYKVANIDQCLHNWRRHTRSSISEVKNREQYESAVRISTGAIQRLLPHYLLDDVILESTRDYVKRNVISGDLKHVEKMFFRVLNAYWDAMPAQHYNGKKIKPVMGTHYLNFAFLYYERNQMHDFRRCTLRSITKDWKRFRMGIVFLFFTSLLGKRFSEEVQIVKNKFILH